MARRSVEVRREQILRAAVEVVNAKGFAATRMEDIAARAGVTKGTIYLYFESKEEVFKSLVRQTIGSTLSQVLDNAVAYEGSARDLLVLVLRTIGTFMRTSDRVVLPKIILAESGNFPELVRFYRFEIIEKGLGLLTSIIRRGIAPAPA